MLSQCYTLRFDRSPESASYTLKVGVDVQDVTSQQYRIRKKISQEKVLL